MRLPTYAFAALLSFIASGCFVDPGPGPDPHGGGGSYGGGNTGGGSGRPSPVPDAPDYLGLQAMLGYHVAAGASAAIPDGDLGYIVTANGQGGYRVSWTDTWNSAARFSGAISTDGYFLQYSQLSGYENVSTSADGRTLYFDSVPGSVLDGLDVVSSTDPIYVDASVDGSRSGFGIYFTGADSGRSLSSAYDPVSFTSP
jgi:hypothetical protein